MNYREPTWSRAFGAFLALLIINLLWNEPLGPLAGDNWSAFVLLNLLPSALAILLIFPTRGKQ